MQQQSTGRKNTQRKPSPAPKPNHPQNLKSLLNNHPAGTGSSSDPGCQAGKPRKVSVCSGNEGAHGTSPCHQHGVMRQCHMPQHCPRSPGAAILSARAEQKGSQRPLRQTLLAASSIQALHLDMGPTWQEQQSNCSRGAQECVVLQNLEEILTAMNAGGQETSTRPPPPTPSPCSHWKGAVS